MGQGWAEGKVCVSEFMFRLPKMDCALPPPRPWGFTSVSSAGPPIPALPHSPDSYSLHFLKKYSHQKAFANLHS